MDRKIDFVVKIYDVDNYYFNDEVMTEMNESATSRELKVLYDYPHIGGGAEEVFTGIIAVAVNFATSVASGLVVEAVKYAFQVFVEKYKKKSGKKNPAVMIFYGEKEIILDYSFELTDEQKDKLVDASVEVMKELVEQKSETL